LTSPLTSTANFTFSIKTPFSTVYMCLKADWTFGLLISFFIKLFHPNPK
jgi:hypothetical protein